MFENSRGGPRECSKGISMGLKEYSESSIMVFFRILLSSSMGSYKCRPLRMK